MASSNILVSKYKVDDVHLAMEDVGKTFTESQKPAFLASKKVLEQMKKSGDISVETPNKLQKAIAAAKEKYGFVGEYAEEAKDKASFVKDQASALKKKANDLSSAGKSAYKTYYSSPLAYVKSTKSNLFNSVRSVAGLRFKIDDLLIGEGARKLLMSAISGVCGSGNLNPFSEIFKSYKDLLNILDNINLFSNSDLFNAIGKCEKFSDDHAKILTAKSSEIAAQGNAVALADMVTIPGVQTNTQDLDVLMAATADTPTNGDKIVTIYESTGRPVKNILITELPPVVETSSAPPVDVIDSLIINRAGNKQNIITAAATKINLPANPKAIHRAVGVLHPPVKGASKEQLLLKDTIQERLSNPVIAANQIKVTSSVKTHADDKIDNGNIRNVDVSPLQRVKREISVSEQLPTNWRNSSVQTITPPSTQSLDSPDPIIETKLNNVDFVFTEDPIVVIPKKKSYRSLTPWLHVDPEDAVRIKSIKSWKKDLNKETGQELLIPVY